MCQTKNTSEVGRDLLKSRSQSKVQKIEVSGGPLEANQTKFQDGRLVAGDLGCHLQDKVKVLASQNFSLLRMYASKLSAQNFFNQFPKHTT